MDKIYINRMEFYGYHGVFPEETRLGQRFAVDLAVGLSLEKAGLSDNLEESVNYGELFHVCKEVVEGDPFKLIEAVAEKIASRVLREFPLVMEVMVKVIKPDPPIPGHYRSVAIEITRRR
ncbi:dihydroneopterin aldolase [Bacillus sp. EB01]|uniref:dihydroneopterin aldolase n=1 Tax=Bacillus sp. EB01 TaxID=1347086 RepID=UPI0005C4921F|nr:dihydroneopterin aldolase [Bacillus sp. EB01]